MKCIIIRLKTGETRQIPYAQYDRSLHRSSGIPFEVADATPKKKEKKEVIPKVILVSTVEEVVEQAEDDVESEGLTCECGKVCASRLGLASHIRACKK